MERRYHLVLDAKQVALVTLAWVVLIDLANADAKNAAKMATAFRTIRDIDPVSVEKTYSKLGKLLDAAIKNERGATEAAKVLEELKRANTERGSDGD